MLQASDLKISPANETLCSSEGLLPPSTTIPCLSGGGSSTGKRRPSTANQAPLFRDSGAYLKSYFDTSSFFRFNLLISAFKLVGPVQASNNG